MATRMMAFEYPDEEDFVVDPVYEHIRAPKFYEFDKTREEVSSGESYFSGGECNESSAFFVLNTCNLLHLNSFS